MNTINQKNIALLLVMFVLSGCKTTLVQTDNAYIELSQKSSIEITQAIEVEPDSARAFFQNGELITVGQLNLYAVNCEIEINTVSEKRQTIEPGVFDIISISQGNSPLVNRQFKEVMVAALDYAWIAASPVDIKRFFHIKLSAQDTESQSQVRSVICRGAQDRPYEALLPTYEEMRTASGKYIIFNF